MEDYRFVYVDETDLSKELSDFFHIQGKTTKEAFERRHVTTSLLESKEDIYSYLSQFIADRPYINTMSFSDGVTLYQLDLFNWARQNADQLGGGRNQPAPSKKQNWPLHDFWRTTTGTNTFPGRGI